MSSNHSIFDIFVGDSNKLQPIHLKVYIVIPAYNEAEFIGDTLQSLADQTVRADKIVVVNDRSTDDTENIVKEFAEKYNFITLS